VSKKERETEQEAAAPEGAPSASDGVGDGDGDGDVAPPAAGYDGGSEPVDRPDGVDGGVSDPDERPDAIEGGVHDGEPADELTELREQSGRYLELAQRTQADFDNYRKRMTRDVRAAEAKGIGKLARELLPALDNLERALSAVEAADPKHEMTQGLRLVSAELGAALARAGIESYSPVGEPFDPSHHEAVAQQPFEGAESGSIVQVLQAGYRLNETILRPARVIVAS